MSVMLLMGATCMFIFIGLLTWIKVDDWLDKKKGKDIN